MIALDRKLEIRTTTNYDTTVILLERSTRAQRVDMPDYHVDIIDETWSVIGAWPIADGTDQALTDYLSDATAGIRDDGIPILDLWDATCPDETDPDAYGELIPDDEIRRDLYCPACGLWIGDPDDPTISMISLKHDSAGYNGSWHCA